MQSTASNRQPDKENAVITKPSQPLAKPVNSETALASQHIAVLAENESAPTLRRALATYDALHGCPVS